jgi:hypothetical protein
MNSEPGTTKDQVSLDDLKRAIFRHVEITGDGYRVHYRAEAWRAAFLWREGWRERGDALLPGPGNGYAEWKQEGIEGMQLIREKVK